MEIRSFIQRLKTYSLPRPCVLCQSYHQEASVLCDFCYQFLKPIQTACLICKKNLIETSFALCGQCIKKRPYFDSVITAYYYEGPIKKLFHDYKYYHALYLKKFFSHLMLDAIKEHHYHSECLIPIPLHPKRLKYRGYNQALELTKIISKATKIPYEDRICTKIINTQAQVALNKSQRQNNLKGVFHLKLVPYKKVTLVDDLFTTGATANEVAGLFKQQGVLEVDLLCCARAL